MYVIEENSSLMNLHFVIPLLENFDSWKFVKVQVLPPVRLS